VSTSTAIPAKYTDDALALCGKAAMRELEAVMQLAKKVKLESLKDNPEDLEAEKAKQQHSYVNTANMILHAVEEYLLPIPFGERTSERLLAGMKRYFEPAEYGARMDDATNLLRIPVTSREQIAALEQSQAVRRADRKLAMAVLAENLGLGTQWSQIYKEIDTDLKARLGRAA
jgi:hypothetical protein